MNKKNTLPLAVVMSLLTGNLFAAGHFTNAPGAQSVAMSGAARALIDDESAVFSNPAKLAGQDSQWVVGWQHVPEFDETGDIDLDAHGIFVGGHQRIERNFRGDLSIGLYYFNPYSIHYKISDGQQPGSTYGTIEQNIHVFALPYSAEFMERKLKVGVVMQMYAVTFGDSSLTRRDDINVPNKLSFDGGDRKAASLAVSADYLWQPENQAFDMNFSTTWNFGNLSDGAFSFADPELAKIFLDKPRSLSIGTALNKQLSQTTDLHFTADYEYEDWFSNRKIESGSVGVKLAHRYTEKHVIAGLFSFGRSDIGGKWSVIPVVDIGHWSTGLTLKSLNDWTVNLGYQRLNYQVSANDNTIVGRFAFDYQKHF